MYCRDKVADTFWERQLISYGSQEHIYTYDIHQWENNCLWFLSQKKKSKIAFHIGQTFIQRKQK